MTTTNTNTEKKPDLVEFTNARREITAAQRSINKLSTANGLPEYFEIQACLGQAQIILTVAEARQNAAPPVTDLVALRDEWERKNRVGRGERPIYRRTRSGGWKRGVQHGGIYGDGEYEPAD